MKYYLFQLLTMFVWMAFFEKSDSYFAVYLLIGIAGILCWNLYRDEKKLMIKKSERVNLLLASVFSLTVMAANYKLFTQIPVPGGEGRVSESFLKFIRLLTAFPVVFLGGLFLIFYILKYIKQKAVEHSWKEHEYTKKSGLVFGTVMLVAAAINSLILFVCYYPGMLTPDSIMQIEQILEGTYSNHHPFYHTMVIRLWLKIGMWIFGDMNAAVAVYSMFSIIFMAAVFAYAVTTLYQMKLNIKIMIAAAAVYILLPCHICYSMTMWKDIMFGGWVLIFLVSVFRYTSQIGKRKSINICLMTVSALGMCLFRSNGFFAFIVTTVMFGILFGKQYKRICLLFLGVIAVSYVLKHPVLEYMEVTQPDTIESLSIPAQQIARVVVDCNDLTKSQKELLSEIIDIPKIKEAYKPFISDPVKELVRDKENQEYLAEHKFDYLKLYLEIGLSHPLKYVEAWIDQTRGYWEGGNNYWIWNTKVEPNTIGIERTCNSKLATVLMEAYFWYFRNIEVLKLFLSIGLHTWLVILAGYAGYVRKNKNVVFAAIPVLAIIVSLLIGTPVYSEFRYIYAMFCCVPFLAVIPFWNQACLRKEMCDREEEPK